MNPDPRAVIQVHIYLRCPKSLPVRPKAAPNHPHAGRCNGVKARCKFCTCGKPKLPCFGCHLARHGRCHNSIASPPSSQLSPSHRLSIPRQSSLLLSTEQLAPTPLHCQQLSSPPHIPPRNPKPPTPRRGFVRIFPHLLALH